jgi:drug/metabolite transporter (DMT)-like permease
MRRRVVGAALTVVGVLMVLFAPVGGAISCPNPGFCHVQGASDWWGLVNYPPGWGKLAVPMALIGIALVVTGVVLVVKRRRSRRSPLVG